MKKWILSLLVGLILSPAAIQAQDTLPKFSVRNVGNNRIVIGWINNYTNVKQISIQRSFDSLTGYKSILTMADPTTPQNGYVDTKATNDHMFYRIYIVLDKGFYLFSDAKQPVVDTSRRFDAGYRVERYPNGDSIAGPNVNNNKARPNSFIPSLYVYTNRDGYVRINLPDEEKPKKYSIKFFEEGETLLFELKDIKERSFKIDKTNFYHGGWFHFELYEDGKLLERHKFYLEKDF